MKDQNKSEDKNLNIDTIENRLKRYIEKKESIISKILYLISIGWFLYESIILSLAAAYGYSLNIVAWIFLLIVGGFFILVPILHYFKTIKELNSSEIKSFEMLGSLIFFIVGIIVNYIPEFTIIIISTFYPGKYVIGVITIITFILMSLLFIRKPSIRVKKT